MTDPDPGKDEKPVSQAGARNFGPWVKPLIASTGLALVAVATGFGVGYMTRSDNSGPDLTRQEAYLQAREQTRLEISRDMARSGFDAGRKSGYTHGMLAGGMAAESAVTIIVREQQTASAQAAAASAQSELAGMAAAPAPPVPSPYEG